MFKNKHLTIGSLAKLANINVETIRYYQKIKLIDEPPKPLRGYRIYSDDTILQLKFIRQAKLAGFTLSEIRELLSLDINNDCQEARHMAQDKLSTTINKINELNKIKITLEEIIQNCTQNQSSKCPILESFIKNR